MPGPQKYSASVITDWDNEIKKHIPEEKITENGIDDFDEFVLSIQSEDDINMTTTSDSITYDVSEFTSSSSSSSFNMQSQGTINIDLDLFTFHDNIETHEQRTERRIESIEKRLCILEPKPEMIQQYEVLKDLYNQYRAAEALLYGNDPDEDEEDKHR
jgi:hypothetical protein